MRNKRILLLINDVVLMSLAGLINSWSIFKKPFAIKFGWNDIELTWTFAICLVCFCLGGFFAARIKNKISYANIVRIAAVLILIGFLLTSRVGFLWELYISYGVLIGFSIGVVYNCVLTTANSWFPEKTGYITGLLLFSFGASGLLFSPLITLLIKYIGLGRTFEILGNVFFVIMIFVSFSACMSYTATSMKINVTKHARKKFHEEGLDIKTSEMLKRSSFWLYFMWTTLLSAMGFGLVSQVSTIAGTFGLDAVASSFSVGIVSLCMGIGKFVFSIYYDFKGRKKTIASGTVLSVAGALLLVGAISFNIVELMYAAFILMGLGFGSVAPTNSNYIRGFYGTANFSLNFSVINFNMFISVLLGQLIGSVLYVSTGSYLITAFVMTFIGVVGFACASAIKKA